MRRLQLLVMCMVGLATTLVILAQPPTPAEPLVGTWRLNPAHTRASAAAPLRPPAERTETYRLTSAGDLELSLNTTAADGTSSTSTLVFSARGGVIRQAGAPAGQLLIETRLGPGEWLVTYLADGVQYMTMRKVVSEDGRTMRQSMSGVTRGGDAWDGLLVFERQ